MSWFSHVVENVAKYNPYTLAAKGAWNIADTALGYATDGAWDRILGKFTGETEQERYEKQLSMQYEAWAREDSAAQRRATDLEKAGLSPVLAAGSSAGSSGPISLSRGSDAGDPTAIAAMMMNLIQQKRNIDLSYTQEKLIKEQIQNVNTDSLEKLAKIGKVNAETANQYLDYMSNTYEFDLAKEGKTSLKHPSIVGGQVRDLTRALKDAGQSITPSEESLRSFNNWFDNAYWWIKQKDSK